MIVKFHKYHGTGNDFILINNQDNSLSCISENQIKIMCSRRFGIGADGLMLLNTHSKYDFEMKYFNSDGSGGTMCGNGGRCIVAFAQKIGLNKKDFLFIASDGEHKAFVNDDNSIKLMMMDVSSIEKKQNGYYCYTGSPHFVKFAENIENIDVYTEGRKIRNSDKYKEKGVNVNFVEIIDKNKLYVRTYERGVENETFSCGTGVVASALTYAKYYLKEENYCNIITKGGNLKIYFNKVNDSFNKILLEGPVTFVFEGEIEIK